MALRRDAQGHEVEVPLDEVRPGDLLLVKPGARVPVDGVVCQGRSAVDESLLTGESMPVDKAPGDPLVGGSINGTGSLLMKAEKVGQETLVAEIVRMVGEAQRSRAPIQRLADAVAAWFVPAVLGTAGLTFATWMLAGPEPRLAHALMAAVSVLIIACPCALGLATPMSIMVAAGRGAAAGVLFRNAEAIETLGRVDTLVVDKTGTLTEGHPRLLTIEPGPAALSASGQPAQEADAASLLRLAAAVERRSEHPLAAAIVEAARERGLALPDPERFASLPGQGATGMVDGRTVAVGSEGFLRGLDIDVLAGDPGARAAALRRDGQTVVLVAVDGRSAGLLGLSDPIRASTPAALDRLRSEGLRIVMATGDNRLTAEAVAGRLGLEEVAAEILPAGKRDLVARLEAEGRLVAMAGDGVNDAPALAAAHVGVALGSGTAVAIGSAGVTLVRGDLAALLRARRLSRAALRNIRQNLFFAFAYNALCIPVAAGALYPVWGWLLSPMLASLAMSLSSVTVITNSLRLRRLAL
jgi:Cu+-exporting ATPase